MNWVIICVLLAFLIYFSYNILVISNFGVPHSLSQTYYLFKEKKEWMKILFPIMMILVATLLLPSWIVLSSGNNFQFTAFLSAMGIMFTGACPTFANSKMEDRVHTYSAYFAAIMSILWIILVSKLWWMILLWGIIILGYAFLFKNWKNKLIYWFETIVFLSTFSSMIYYIVG